MFEKFVVLIILAQPVLPNNPDITKKNARRLMGSVACLAGQFYDDIHNNCVNCPEFSTSKMGSVGIGNCSCIPGYTNFSIGNCTACTPGKYKNSNGSAPCAFCLVGKFSTAFASTSQTMCQSCAVGKFSSNEGRSYCTTCTAGSFQSGFFAANCTSCDAGSYTTADGAAMCIPCTAGTFQTAIGSTVCMLCESGTFQSSEGSSTCLACFRGSYQSTIGASVCKFCPQGSTSMAGSISFANCTCDIGFSGIVSLFSVICFACASGKYKTMYGPSACMDCPIASSSPPGSSSISNCSCNAGYFQSNNSCSPCVPGTFNPVAASTSCTACSNHSSSGFASASCICNDGFVAIVNGARYCSQCSAGKYKQSEILCSACPAGKYHSFNSSNPSPDCEACPAGDRLSVSWSF